MQLTVSTLTDWDAVLKNFWSNCYMVITYVEQQFCNCTVLLHTWAQSCIREPYVYHSVIEYRLSISFQNLNFSVRCSHKNPEDSATVKIHSCCVIFFSVTVCYKQGRGHSPGKLTEQSRFRDCFPEDAGAENFTFSALLRNVEETTMK